MENRFRFRAWIIDEKRYATKLGSFKFDDKNRHQEIEELQNNGRFCTLYKSDNYILEQCTGVEDKNGKFIYENDLIKEDGCNRVWCVEWDNHLCGFYPFSYDHNFETLEVIGNIHENPELLKK